MGLAEEGEEEGAMVEGLALVVGLLVDEVEGSLVLVLMLVLLGVEGTIVFDGGGGSFMLDVMCDFSTWESWISLCCCCC